MGEKLKDTAATSLSFEWDAKKSRMNIKKHGLSFEEAVSVFGDPLSITIIDPDHSEVEERQLSVGQSSTGKTVVVAHTSRSGRIRLISAREATKNERLRYEETPRKKGSR